MQDLCELFAGAHDDSPWDDDDPYVEYDVPPDDCPRDWAKWRLPEGVDALKRYIERVQNGGALESGRS
jgi:hypothetical protein